MSGVFVGLQLSKGNLCKQWYGESFRGRELGIKYRISGESIVVLDKIIVKNTLGARGRGGVDTTYKRLHRESSGHWTT